jgi:hypothetical protein
VAQDGKIIVNEQAEKSWKKAAVAYFKVTISTSAEESNLEAT